VATFVLVHGGGHGGWCYQPVARLLRAAGHEVYAPSLSGLGERAHVVGPAINLDTHITDIVKLLQFEDLHDVILVGHSYGGMVITGIADRAADRIGHLVFLDAATPVNGQSLVDVAGPMMAMARSMGRIENGIEMVLHPNAHFLAAYGITDPALAEWVLPRLTPHPWACFEQALVLENEVALGAVPQTHIICTATIPGRDIEGLKSAHGGRVWDIDTGHDLMLTEPQKVTDLLLKVVAL
jgi:pimeloyl-ACP methyl ester carboxylesterase